MNYYTGVGSRKTPKSILDLMQHIGVHLERKGYTLRTGGAEGADTAFAKQVERCHVFRAADATQHAMDIAARFHPAWDRCSMFAKRLHGRNAFQVLGVDLATPSHFLICWTPDGCISHETRSIRTGGTGTAISIADHYGVRVYNLARDEHRMYWLGRLANKHK